LPILFGFKSEGKQLPLFLSLKRERQSASIYLLKRKGGLFEGNWLRPGFFSENIGSRVKDAGRGGRGIPTIRTKGWTIRTTGVDYLDKKVDKSDMAGKEIF
jgi:hypothetical protein